jgi:hypothetical protein
MRTGHLCLVGFVAILAWPSMLGGQTLADVARAEEARRKAVKVPSKVYTNDDLKGAGGSSAPTPALAAQPAPAGGAQAAGAAKPDAAKADQPPAPGDEPKKDEQYWRGRITAARDTLAHDKVLADALQSRVNALTTDFTNASDPAQRAVI